ncbi:MAG: tetratricopeptide repeat protein [Opitutaceae bacterium]|nr:tetratricopeptide repeat protein [Opitutaceae bacterium]
MAGARTQRPPARPRGPRGTRGGRGHGFHRQRQEHLLLAPCHHPQGHALLLLRLRSFRLRPRRTPARAHGAVRHARVPRGGTRGNGETGAKRAHPAGRGTAQSAPIPRGGRNPRPGAPRGPAVERSLSAPRHVETRNPDYPGAVADFTQSIRLEPKEPTAYVGRGLAREKSGDLAGALADYSEGIALDPNYKNAWGYRGTLRLKQKDYSESIQDFNQALRLDPDSQWSAWAYNNRGMAKEKLGDTPGARRDFQAALALNPGDANARKNLDALK